MEKVETLNDIIAKHSPKEIQRIIRKWESLTIKDNFLFQGTMMDTPYLCYFMRWHERSLMYVS